jgi:hypothetical protein
MSNSEEIESRMVTNAIDKLDLWIDKNGWAGYDPYDLFGTHFFLRLQRFPENAWMMARGLRRTLFYLEHRWPRMMRGLFGIEKQVNPKAMGLFARGYLSLFQRTRRARYKERATYCLNWLINNPSLGYSGYCWGYPFDWQSKIFIPKDTPSAVVTCVIGDSFWWAYKILRAKKYLEICEEICRFLIEDLNIDEIDVDTICFSYTPLDDFHVHNANLFVAEYLTRVGDHVRQRELVDLGEKAANYALREQNNDGSIYYWGRVQNHFSPNHIDHYHSGFEIRALYGLWRLTGKEQYKRAVTRYYRFYREHLLLFKSDGMIIPKMTPSSTYPVNIHSCAEAILCNAKLSEVFEDGTKILPGVTKWTIENFHTKKGWFAYRIDLVNGKKRAISFPFIRWGQAWMLNALAQIVVT